MGQSIVQIKQMGDALRSSGYKSIDSAVAELIDNSIEAGAHDIFVIMTEHVDPDTHRKAIHEFAILDNGSGMDISKLASCLGIGFTTKSDRRGMGRFGVGLPQASLHVTPNVEVYSWTEDDGPIEPDDPVYQVWLNIDKVKTGEQEEIDDPTLMEIPEQYKSFLKYRTLEKFFDFTQHGTLVYWKNCDNIKPKTMATLNEKLEFALGRKFRHLIADGTHNIRLVTIGHEDNAIDVLPNDPLFMMTPNFVLGNPANPTAISERSNAGGFTEPIFAQYGDDIVIPVPYIHKETREKRVSDVIVRFSTVRAEFYDRTAIPTGNVGDKPLGKFVKKLEGVSVVRAGREIDFGTFDFYDKTNTPHDRWWGCEIIFNPALDELFGVSNNKQQVELSRSIFEQEAGEDRGNLYAELHKHIYDTINKMRKANAKLREGSRSNSDNEDVPPKVVSIVEDDNQKYDDDTGEAQNIRDQISDDEREKRAREYLESQGEDPTVDAIRRLVSKELSFRYADLRKNGPFFDTDFSFGNVAITINTSHIFYEEFISKMDETNRVAFELFIAALAKAINRTNIDNVEANDELLQEWDIRLKRYLKQIKGN